jgi:Phage protein Gp138 N-terminal domain
MSVPSELAPVLEAILRYKQSQLWTSLPGRVEKYSASTQLADIKPLINDQLLTIDGDDQVAEVISLPVIKNVPIMFPRGGPYAISFPLAVGDTVELHFSSRSLDLWKTQGGEVNPVSTRQHDLSDATAQLGLYAQPSKLTSAHASHFVLGHDTDASLQMHIDGSAFLFGASATDPIALSSKVTSLFTGLKNAISGWVPVPNDGGAALKAALAAWLAGSSDVASTRVKAL